MESCPPPSMARIFSLRVSAMIESIGETYELTVETLSSAAQSTFVEVCGRAHHRICTIPLHRRAR